MFAGSARHGTPGGGPRTFGPRQPRVLARSRLPWRRAGARVAEAMVAAEAVAAAEAAEAVERRRREEEPAEAAAKREARAEEEEVAVVVVEEEAVVEEEEVKARRRPSVGAGLRSEHSEAGGTHAASGVGSALISWSGSVVSGQWSGPTLG